MLNPKFNAGDFKRDMMRQVKKNMEHQLREAILKLEPNCPDLHVNYDLDTQKITITGVSEEVAQKALESITDQE